MKLSVPVLMQNMRAQCSMITCHEQYLATQSKIPLGNIKQAEITNKLYKLNAHAKDHEVLQITNLTICTSIQLDGLMKKLLDKW